MKEMLIGQPIRRFNGNDKKWDCILWYAYIADKGDIDRNCIVGDTVEDVIKKLKEIEVAYHSE